MIVGRFREVREHGKRIPANHLPIKLNLIKHMRSLRLSISFLAAAMLVATFSSTSSAMPNFARKYNLGCSACHTVVPCLNEFGFKFRSAGYRLPEEIGKDSKIPFNLGEYLAGRIQVNAEHIAQTKTTSSPTASATTLNQNDIQFFEVTLYPLTGSITKNISSLVELSNSPEDVWEIENAFVRYNWGEEENYWSVKAGIFHPFEGYGAFDRPLGLSRPIFQGGAPPKTSNAANNTSSADFSTEFQPWGFDQVGVELGWSYKNTFLRGTIFNGIYADSVDDGRGWIGQPAQGGLLIKPNRNKFSDMFGGTFDLQFTVTQLLTDDGGGISGYFYRGQNEMPAERDSLGNMKFYPNNFLRYAIYASYPIQKALLLGGYQSGTDASWDTKNHVIGDNFNSSGYFLEGRYMPFDQFGFGARYDYFEPSTTFVFKDKNGNASTTGLTAQNAITAFVNYAFGDGFQLIGEYKDKFTKKGIFSDGTTKPDQNDNSVTIRMIWIQ